MADGKLRAARQLSAWLISFLTAELALPSLSYGCGLQPCKKGFGFLARSASQKLNSRNLKSLWTGYFWSK